MGETSHLLTHYNDTRSAAASGTSVWMFLCQQLKKTSTFDTICPTIQLCGFGSRRKTCRPKLKHLLSLTIMFAFPCMSLLLGWLFIAHSRPGGLAGSQTNSLLCSALVFFKHSHLDSDIVLKHKGSGSYIYYKRWRCKSWLT